MSGQNLDNDIKVAIARGIHLFPFRTEKLSLVTPMVLRNSGRVGSRRLGRIPSVQNNEPRGFLFLYDSSKKEAIKKTGSVIIILNTDSNIFSYTKLLS